MKKIILSFLTLGLLINSFAQTEYKKLPSLGIHFLFNDFKTAADLRNSGLANVIRDKNWSKTSRMTPGLALSFMQGLSNNIDFAATASGSFVDYPVPDKISNGNAKFLLDITAVAHLKLTPDKYWVSPYLTLGVGASKFQGYFGAFIPTGAGLQVNLFDESFLLINSQYRIPVTENVAYHLYHSIGFAGSIATRKAAEPAPLPPPPPVEAPKDRDNDGVLDENDKCPDIPGIASLQGCADKDGDGIADGDDKCPAVAGLARYQGCPVPDRDKDGINDENDKCVDVPGVARYQGCPVPDTDKDGVNDEEDKCPAEAGPATNYGCPVIETVVVEKVNKAAQNIFFATGSAKLLAKSNASLNNVVSILNENPGYKVDIDGHTDITGSPEKNQVLSEARANSVKTYLVSKGIAESRLIATGYGIDKPIADNKTAAGRSKNRRVEMKLRNY
ncbi:MAG: OmpA family protein [Ferruginibacter sp.]|nr:OmpA family protein [Ferruginibacter sp.]